MYRSTGCLLTSQDYRLLQRVRHWALGGYSDAMSDRFDRQADTSKNIRDVSKPETALLLLLLHKHTTTLNLPADSVNVTHLFRQL